MGHLGMGGVFSLNSGDSLLPGRDTSGVRMREAELAVQVAGMSAFSASKACLALSTGNRLIAPRANRIDCQIVVTPPRERNKGLHPVTPVRWSPPGRLEISIERAVQFPRYDHDCGKVWS